MSRYFVGGHEDRRDRIARRRLTRSHLQNFFWEDNNVAIRQHRLPISGCMKIYGQIFLLNSYLFAYGCRNQNTGRTMPIDLADAVIAISGLGTSSFALVDASKAINGGASNYGFSFVTRVLDNLFPPNVDKADNTTPITYGSIRDTLRANWLNGTALSDQKSIAKTLIKLRLNPQNAAFLAGKTGVDAEVLSSLAEKYVNGGAPSEAELNVAGRFDLLLTTLLDEAYQRADQTYRNRSQATAVGVSVVLSLVGWLSLGRTAGTGVDFGVAFLVGLLAAPLAPVSKDLASALQASVQAMQFLRK